MNNQKQEITIEEFATKVSNCFFLEPKCETLAEELRCLNLDEIPNILTEKDCGFKKQEFEEACKFFKTSKIKKINLYDKFQIFLAIYIRTVYDETYGILPTLLDDFVDKPEFSNIEEAIKLYKITNSYNDVSNFFTDHKTWKKPINNWNSLLNELDGELRIYTEADF